MRKYALLLICAVVCIVACHKNTVPHKLLSPVLKGLFGYKVGSYWVYKDSVNNEIDSFYVYYSSAYTEHNGTDDVDRMDMSLRKGTTNPNDSEKWFFTLIDSAFSIGFESGKDSVEWMLTGVTLFTYPFKLGNLFNSNGDSGAVTNGYPTFFSNGMQFGNTICSYHKNIPYLESETYKDYFYVSVDAGITKVIFNHPQDSVYRVLELERYKIVK